MITTTPNLAPHESTATRPLMPTVVITLENAAVHIARAQLGHPEKLAHLRFLIPSRTRWGGEIVLALLDVVGDPRRRELDQLQAMPERGASVPLDSERDDQAGYYHLSLEAWQVVGFLGFASVDDEAAEALERVADLRLDNVIVIAVPSHGIDPATLWPDDRGGVVVTHDSDQLLIDWADGLIQDPMAGGEMLDHVLGDKPAFSLDHIDTSSSSSQMLGLSKFSRPGPDWHYLPRTWPDVGSSIELPPDRTIRHR